MRTVGKFVDVYKQAKSNDVSHIPSDPVVRLESDGQWMIESRTEPCERETVIEVSLDDFQAYWRYSFEDENYIPTEQDVADYVKFVEETQI